MQAVYSDYVPTEKIKSSYWKDIHNQKAFFDQLAAKWNIQKTEEWNKVTTQMVMKEGGAFINNYYNSSLQQGTHS